MAATLAQIGSNWPTFAQIGSQISPTIERCPLKQRADGTKRTSFCVTFRNAWLKRRAKECLLTQKSNVTLPQTTKVLVYYGIQFICSPALPPYLHFRLQRDSVITEKVFAYRGLRAGYLRRCQPSDAQRAERRSRSSPSMAVIATRHGQRARHGASTVTGALEVWSGALRAQRAAEPCRCCCSSCECSRLGRRPPSRCAAVFGS